MKNNFDRTNLLEEQTMMKCFAFFCVSQAEKEEKCLSRSKEQVIEKYCLNTSSFFSSSFLQMIIEISYLKEKENLQLVNKQHSLSRSINIKYKSTKINTNNHFILIVIVIVLSRAHLFDLSEGSE